MQRVIILFVIFLLLISACQSAGRVTNSEPPCPTATSINGTPPPIVPCAPAGDASEITPMVLELAQVQPAVTPASTGTPSPTVTLTITPTATINPTPTLQPTPAVTTLLFTGVVVPARCVQAKIDELDNPDYPYEEVREIISQADLAVATYNATMTDFAPRTGCVRTYVLVGGSENADALKRAGFDLAGVATNHIKDCGPATCGDQAFFDTLENLRRVNIPYFGAGSNQSQALEPVVVTINGVRFGFVSAGDSKQGDWTFAGPDSPGIARLTSENIITAIESARRVADVVIFMPHWGSEDNAIPSWVQRNQAQEIAAAGPDLVVGNHTHVVQAIEEIEGIPVFYGLGNFVFDQDLEDHQQGVILLVRFQGKEFAGYEIIPTRFNEYGRVSVADARASAEVLNRIELASRAVGSEQSYPYRPSMPLESAAGLPREEIVSQLFEQYLEAYHNPVQPDRRRIVDSEIHTVSVNPEDQTRSGEFGVNTIAQVIYSVRPILFQTDWMVGNGEQTQDSWVRQKSIYVGLKEELGRYWLVLLGTGL